MSTVSHTGPAAKHSGADFCDQHLAPLLEGAGLNSDQAARVLADRRVLALDGEGREAARRAAGARRGPKAGAPGAQAPRPAGSESASRCAGVGVGGVRTKADSLSTAGQRLTGRDLAGENDRASGEDESDPEVIGRAARIRENRRKAQIEEINLRETARRARYTPELAAAAKIREERRRTRAGIRAVLARESKIARVRRCGTHRVNADKPRKLVLNSGVAHVGNVQHCGAIWACPVCSAKVRNIRARLIGKAALNHMKTGGEVWMATLTVRHKRAQALAPMLDSIYEVFGDLLKGRASDDEKKLYGRFGHVRSVEVMWATENGWHPHLHVLVFMAPDQTPDQLARIQGRWTDDWLAWMARHGYPPDRAHGVDWTKCEKVTEAGEYIAKTQDGKPRHVGNEMARGDLKSGRLGSLTPFQLLEYFRSTGDRAALDLWHEYEAATKGHRAIEPSRGLYKALLSGQDREEAEKTSEQLANAETAVGRDVALIPDKTWAVICTVPGLYADVLTAAEHGGITAVNALLAPHGVRVEPPPDPS